MKSKVLLIDDSVTIHRVIDLSIDFDRYDIVKVFSKDDAALKIQSEQFDYILLDNKLENIIISEYIAEIKQQQSHASVILLVGAFDRFDESNLEKTNADDYLVKPFDSQSLNEKLSSDVGMMPAGIVERIAEADFARDNDDYISPTSITKNEVVEGITKEEYLDNLEEQQPDDLTEEGYVEDLDGEQSAKENNANEIVVEDNASGEELVEENNIIEESAVTPENNVKNMVSLEDLDVEDDEVELEEDALLQNDMPLSSIDLDEPLQVSKSKELAKEQEEDNIVENVTVEEVVSEESVVEENMDIPDLTEAVHSPILHDIDDASEISDDYLMQENLAEVEDSGEVLDEFPDFPEMDDVSTDEMQDVIDNQAEEVAVTEEVAEPVMDIQEEVTDELVTEKMIDPAVAEEIVEPVMDMQEEVTDELVTEEMIEPAVAEEIVEPIKDTAEEQEEVKAQEESPLFEDDDWLNDAPNMEEKQEEVAEELVMDNMDVQEELPEELSEEIAEDENIITEDLMEEEIISETPVFENTVEEVVEESNLEEISVEENSVEEIEEPIEQVEVEEPVMEEPVIDEPIAIEEEIEEQPVLQEEESNSNLTVEHNQQDNLGLIETKLSENEIKEAETYNIDNKNRFGGITVTISRDEIMAMLGTAIDKSFLEEAVREVIAENMKEVVRNVVPAIAEKYIKEEIERLKNDEE